MGDGLKIPLLDIPIDYIVGVAEGKLLNEYGRFPCKIKAGIVAFVARGTAKATVNITEYEFRENDVVILSGNVFFRIWEVSDDALVYYVGFSSEFLTKKSYVVSSLVNDLSHRIGILPLLSVDGRVGETFADAFRLLIKMSGAGVLTSDIMASVLSIMVQVLMSKGVSSASTGRSEDRKLSLYKEFYALVMKHYTREHKLPFYADKMGITLPHLCTTIKQASGHTASKLITDAIITDAKAQLKSTGLQVKEIAVSLGFENMAFFNKFFKANVGMTPKEYRESAL